MMKLLLFLQLVFTNASGAPLTDTLTVKKTTDFEISGNGSAPNWNKTSWVNIPQRKTGGKSFLTKAKILYSHNGIYFLFDCQDEKISASMNNDFMDLWTEDVVEIFLWPNYKTPFYFEYEISPLNYELPILIDNNDGVLRRWQPFHYDYDRKTSHATKIIKSTDNKIKGWYTEFFIPFELIRPLTNQPTVSGDIWKANFYRIDYDHRPSSAWSWQETFNSFHDYEHFGNILFQ